MNYKNLFVAIVLVTIFAAQSFAQAPVTLEECSAISSVELEAQERCYTAVAVQTDTIATCNLIQTPSGISRCKSAILLAEPDYSTIFGTRMIVVYLGILLLLSVIFSSERIVYAYGVGVSLVLFAVYLVLTILPYEFSKSVLFYYGTIVPSIRTVMQYSPDWFSAYSSTTQLAVGFVLIYGQIIANLLHKKLTQICIAILLILLTIGLHWYSEQFFAFIQMLLNALSSLFTV